MVLTREFFGRKNYASIIGFLLGIMSLGTIIGPPLAGWVFDTWGGYRVIWFVLAGLMVVAILSIVTTPPVSVKSVEIARA